MANRWLATNLIRSLKLRSLIPTSEKTFSSDDFLFLLDEAVRLDIVNLILSVNDGDYLTQHLDFAVPAVGARLAIPSRAASEQLELVQVVDSNGAAYPVDDIARRQVGDPSSSGLWFELDDDGIVLVGQPTNTGSVLRIHFRARPGRLVGESACGRVTAINTATKAVTVSAVPVDVTGAGLTTTSVAFTTSLTYDFVHGEPGFRCLGVDLALTSIVGPVLTFAATLPTSLAVGDYVCIAGESPIAQIPEGAHPLLAQWGWLIAERSFGSAERVPVAEKAVEKAEARLAMLLSKQKGSTLTTLVNENAPGWWGSFRGRRWGYGR